jgi:hypothetical protein
MLSSRRIKIKKTKEKRTTSLLKILGDKYKHFRRHLEIDSILIFQDWQQIFFNRTEDLEDNRLEDFIQRFRY